MKSQSTSKDLSVFGSAFRLSKKGAERRKVIAKRGKKTNYAD